LGWRSKNVLIAIAVVAILAIVLVRVHGKETTNVATNPSSAGVSNALVAVANKSLVVDTDNDGLPDWEEVLRKTDPNKSDSDGDGILDGKEVFEDSTIDSRVEKMASELDEEGLTPTQRFGRELLTQYLATKKEGGKFDAESTAKFVDKMTGEVNQEVTVTLFTAYDVQTISDNNLIALKEYANRMGRILIRNSPPGLENEIVVATRALQNKDPEELQKIKPLIESLANSATEGRSVPVPSDLVQLHLDLLNSFVYMKTTLSGLLLIFDDPLTAVVRIAQHKESVKKFRAAFINMQLFYQKANIQFGPKEEGAVFLHFE